MEFFLSSMAGLLIAALIVFLILPRLGATFLVGLSVVLLIGCLYSHYTLFGAEYRFSTWQERAKWYAPVIMYGALALGIIMYLGYLFTGSTPPLPTTNLTAATNNPVVESINNTAKVANVVANNVVNTVNTVANNVANAVVTGNNKPYNKQNNVLSNLGGILNTPKNNQNRVL
jgi:hypothetical protein